MIQIAIRFKSAPELTENSDKASWITGFLMQQDDGSYAIQYPNDQGQPGQYLNVDWNTNYNQSGSPQKFQLDSSLNVVLVTPRILTYKIAIREL